jgi:plastocyanin
MSRILTAIIIIGVILIIGYLLIVQSGGLGGGTPTVPTPAAISPQVTIVPISTSPTAATVTATPAGQTSQVNISNFTFSPATMTIRVGTRVTWTNNDSTTHTVTSDPNGETFSSGNLAPGSSYSFTFNRAGTYPYHCSIHTFMHGTVVVTP